MKHHRNVVITINGTGQGFDFKTCCCLPYATFALRSMM